MAPRMQPPLAPVSRAAAKAAGVVIASGSFLTQILFSSRFLRRLSRERVEKLLHHQLLGQLVFRRLVLNVLFYRLLVPAYRIDVIPPAPELPVAIPVLQVREPVEYHQAALALQVSHERRYADLRRNRNQHVYMVGTAFRLDYLYSLAVAELPQYLSYLNPDLPIDYLPTVFRRENYMIFTVPTGMG